MIRGLSKDEIGQALVSLPTWKFEHDFLKRAYSFETFREAIGFLMQLSFDAEEQDHHPEIYNVYNRVDVSLQTHSAGNLVTHKDVQLAQSIESLYSKVSAR